MPRIPVIAALLFALWLAPARAQTAIPSPLDWIPADFDAFVYVDLSDPAAALQSLNNAAAAAAARDPRLLIDLAPRRLNDFFPADLLDTEGAAFENAILPWLAGEAIIAHRHFDAAFAPGETLLILPAVDSLWAANVLSPVIRAQDFLEQDSYHNWTIYRGDRAAFAILPGMVLIGAPDALKAALDTHYAGAPRLVAAPALAAMRADIDGATAFAYLDGDLMLPALSLLLNADTSAAPLLAAWLEALPSAAGLPVRAAAVGVRLAALPLTQTLEVALLFYQPDASDSWTAADMPVLEAIPRRAMLLTSGANIEQAAWTALHTFPLAGFAGGLLRGFGVDAPESALLPPDAAEIRAAVASLDDALRLTAGVDLRADIFAHLRGAYALALLPNLNNPTPTLNLGFDVLLVAQTAGDGTAQANITRGLARLLRLEFASASVAGETVSAALDVRTGEPILTALTLDDLLIIGTGSAPAEAIRARRGDNRLINTERWQTVGFDGAAVIYADLNAITLLRQPRAGGAVSIGIGQLGAQIRREDDIYRIEIRLTFHA